MKTKMRMHRRAAVLLSLITLVAGPGVLLAEPVTAELQSNVIKYVQLDLLAEQDAFKTEAGLTEMQSVSEGLAPFYQEALYERYRANPWIAAGLNLASGGVGSLLMGDVLFGTINQVGMAASMAAMMVALTLPSNQNDTYYLVAEIGSAVFTVTGLVAPFVYASRHNRRLGEALRM